MIEWKIHTLWILFSQNSFFPWRIHQLDKQILKHFINGSCFFNLSNALTATSYAANYWRLTSDYLFFFHLTRNDDAITSFFGRSIFGAWSDYPLMYEMHIKCSNEQRNKQQ